MAIPAPAFSPTGDGLGAADLGDLYAQYKPVWAAEEGDRAARWAAFLAEVGGGGGGGGEAAVSSASPPPDGAVAAGLDALAAGLDAWRAAGGGLDEAKGEEEEGWLPRLRALAQAGAPLPLRGRLWAAFLGVDAKRAAAEAAAAASGKLGTPSGGPAAPYAALVAAVTASAAGRAGSCGGAPPPPPAQPPPPHAAWAAAADTWDAQAAKDLPRTLPGHPVLDGAGSGSPRSEGEGAEGGGGGAPPPPTAPPPLAGAADAAGAPPSDARLLTSTSGRAALRRLLGAYARRNPRVGYCQGMSHCGALLLLFLGEEAAFWGLAALVEDVLPGYFTHDMAAPAGDAAAFAALAASQFPGLVAGLEGAGADLAAPAGRWFCCAFVGALPLETAARVWDTLLLARGTAGGAAVLVRVGLALLDIYSRALAASADGADAQAALGAMAPACFDGSRLVDTAWAGYGPRVVAAGEVARLRAAAGVEAGRGGERAQPATPVPPSPAGAAAASPFAAVAGVEAADTPPPRTSAAPPPLRLYSPPAWSGGVDAFTAATLAHLAHQAGSGGGGLRGGAPGGAPVPAPSPSRAGTGVRGAMYPPLQEPLEAAPGAGGRAGVLEIARPRRRALEPGQQPASATPAPPPPPPPPTTAASTRMAALADALRGEATAALALKATALAAAAAAAAAAKAAKADLTAARTAQAAAAAAARSGAARAASARADAASAASGAAALAARVASARAALALRQALLAEKGELLAGLAERVARGGCGGGQDAGKRGWRWPGRRTAG